MAVTVKLLNRVLGVKDVKVRYRALRRIWRKAVRQDSVLTYKEFEEYRSGLFTARNAPWWPYMANQELVRRVVESTDRRLFHAVTATRTPSRRLSEAAAWRAVAVRKRHIEDIIQRAAAQSRALDAARRAAKEAA